MITDSHCHLDMLELTEENPSVEDYLARAKVRDVSRFLCISVGRKSYPLIQQIAAAHPEQILISAGVHPSNKTDAEMPVDALVDWMSDDSVVAVGETGLDYFYNEGDLAWQQNSFRHHIRAAKEVNKPLIIHSRDAGDDTLAILNEENAQAVGGVIHCFTETWEFAQAAMDLGFYISFSGIVTFKSAEALRDVAMKVPGDRILVETDAPYLAPVPHRGKQNEPAFVRDVLECVAHLRETDWQTLAIDTSENFDRLFKVA